MSNILHKEFVGLWCPGTPFAADCGFFVVTYTFFGNEMKCISATQVKSHIYWTYKSHLLRHNDFGKPKWPTCQRRVVTYSFSNSRNCRRVKSIGVWVKFWRLSPFQYSRPLHVGSSQPMLLSSKTHPIVLRTLHVNPCKANARIRNNVKRETCSL